MIIKLKVINFISSKPDSDETRIMHAKRNNIEIMIGSETDEIIEDLFKFLCKRYQERLEESMRGSEFFFFDGVDALYYDFNKISLRKGKSYIESPKWLLNKTNDGKCFQYAPTVALNHEQTKKSPQRISKIKPFIDQYKWKEIDFPSHSKKFGETGKSVNQIINQLLLIFCMYLIILKK